MFLLFHGLLVWDDGGFCTCFSLFTKGFRWHISLLYELVALGWMTLNGTRALALYRSDVGVLVLELSVTKEAADGVGDAGLACCILA